VTPGVETAGLPELDVTVEAGDEVHLHACGQGFWVARMIAPGR
jgi:hypothetical protein